jgi:hypothetical protein
MSSCSSNYWVSTTRDSFSGVANNATTAATEIKLSGGSIPSKPFREIHGFQLSVSASSGASHKATVKVYSEAAATYLFHDVTVDLHPNTQETSFLTNPIPLTSAPYFTITDVAGGGGKDYTILFFVKS